MKKETPLEQSIIDRVVTGVKYVVSGITPDGFFTPLQPLAPLAQDKAEGRQFDYPVGWNVKVQVNKEGVSYQELRGMADNYDVLRIVIETRKDQICRLDWDIRYKDGREDDDKIRAVREFFMYPDKEHDHETWLRAILEDLFVLDAPTVYPRMTKGGDLYSLELMDGSTIKRIIDVTGRTPIAPDPAYQQILKGVPAVDYTHDTLIYRPRNKRTNKIYGFSPVEQVMMSVNIAMRRQINQLNYYAEGSVPEALMSVPENWNADQIKQFQDYWSSLMEGNLKEKRHLKFVPHGLQFIPTKDTVLKDEFDDWLARIICLAFSISPASLVKAMNRATAETAQDTAESEGIAPIMQWVKRLHDFIIVKYFKLNDIEYVWKTEVEIDVLRQAQIDDIYVKNGIMKVNEVRERMGLEEIEEPTPEAVAPTKDKIVEQEKPKTEKLAKGGLIEGKPIDRDRKAVTSTEAKLTKLLTVELQNIADKMIADIISTIGKADGDITIPDADLMPLIAIITEKAIYLYKDGVNEAWGAIDFNPTKEMLTVVNENAVEYAKERALELAKLNETTKDMLRPIIAQSLEEGHNTQTLTKNLKEAYAFSKTRAQVIAETEMCTADSAGNHQAYVESGVVKFHKSLLGNNENHGSWDIANAEEGAIPLDQPFKSGHLHPAYHPRCRCVEIAVMEDN